MKKKLLSFSIIMSLVAGAFMMQSCEELKDLAAFDVDKDLPSQYFTLDSASTKDKGEKMLYESSFFVNLDSILEANGVDRGNVSDGRFDQISLSIDNPSPKMQFGFLSKVTFKLSETPDFAVENTIASASNIQVGDTEIVLNINSQNLDNYI
jgi:hypothetical protein